MEKLGKGEKALWRQKEIRAFLCRTDETKNVCKASENSVDAGTTRRSNEFCVLKRRLQSVCRMKPVTYIIKACSEKSILGLNSQARGEARK